MSDAHQRPRKATDRRRTAGTPLHHEVRGIGSAAARAEDAQSPFGARNGREERGSDWTHDS